MQEGENLSSDFQITTLQKGEYKLTLVQII
jgi:hypothetical protein